MNRFYDGARVCFIGDSLTAQNQFLPLIINHYKNNFPDSGIRFFNCGVAGGTAKRAIDFFEDDVAIYNPTHAVVEFGVNDSNRLLLEHPKSIQRYDKLNEAFEQYKKNLTALCDMIKERGIELILCTPAPYDEYTETEITAYKGGYALIAAYADYARTLAREKSIPLCDYHQYLSRILQNDNLYTPDHVHPDQHGYYHMAKYFLSLQGLDLGQETPVPEYFNNWHEKVTFLRNIYATEGMLIPDYGIPLKEKLSFMEKYVEAKEWDNEYFGKIAKE